MVFAFAGDSTITKFFAMYLSFFLITTIETAYFQIAKVCSFFLLIFSKKFLELF
jgi:hypothetical protein